MGADVAYYRGMEQLATALMRSITGTTCGRQPRSSLSSKAWSGCAERSPRYP